MWQLIWVFAGEAPYGVRSQKSGVGGQTCQISALRSINFVIGLGSVTVAARIRSFFCTVTVRSILVIIANPAAPPQSIQNQTGRPNPCLCQQGNRAAQRRP